MKRVSNALLAVSLFCAALPNLRAQEPWADLRFQHRIPLTVSSVGGRSFATGDVVVATVPTGAIPARRADGADIVVYQGGAALPARALPMGGSVKVLFSLPAPLTPGNPVSGLYLYTGAPSVSTPPAAPAGVITQDFSDGNLHGWKSLQRPGDANSLTSDIRAVDTISDVPVMAFDTSQYHHPMFFADDLSAMTDATVYAAVQTRGGENEFSLLQRFNTQVLVDNKGVAYFTGANRPAAGLAIDAFGSLRILVHTPLGAPEGVDGRRRPGPATFSAGGTYAADPEKVQYLVSATRDIGTNTQVAGKAWQAPPSTPPGAPGDPAPGAFQVIANVPGGSLPAGKPAAMIYGTTAFVRWMTVVPNGFAESIITTMGAGEDAPAPPSDEAVVRGVVYNAQRGLGYPVDRAAVTIRDANGATLATFTTDETGHYNAPLSVGAGGLTVTVEATSPDGAGSASGTIEQGSTHVLNVPLEWTGRATGVVTDAVGNAVPNATVGLFLDGGPYVQTDDQGHYELPVPTGTSIIGAHQDGTEISGPRWLTAAGGAIDADFALFPAGSSLLHGLNPTVTPASGSSAAITDGNFATAWTGDETPASPSSPTTITWDLPDATIGQVEVHWKNPPTAWRLEMANIITNGQGGNPQLDSRVYYEAGGAAPPETGGYLAPGTTDRHVVAVKSAPVWGVKKLSIIITGAPEAGAPSLYEVKASAPQPTTFGDAVTVLQIASGLRPLPNDPNAFMRWNAHNADQKLTLEDAVELLRAPLTEVKDYRVFVINYIPVIEAEGNRTAREIFNWFNPFPQTEGHRQDMELASHGYLRIHLLPQAVVDGYPVFSNGFRFTDDTFMQSWRTRTNPPGGADYPSIIKEFDLVRRVAVGDVDEVWIQAPPNFGMPETIMAGANAYWCNSGPVPGRNGNRLFVFTNFNYERAMDVMIHDWGHRSESILGLKVYGGWNPQSGRTTWDRFSRYDKITPGQAGAGNTHWPPNAVGDYDYWNTTYVSSDADDWLNYPNLTGAREMINRNAWSLPHRGYDGGIDWQRNYLIWWFSRFPHAPGVAPDGKQANWWKYVADMNRFPESR